MKFPELVASVGGSGDGAAVLERTEGLPMGGPFGLILMAAWWLNNRRSWFPKYGLVVVRADEVAIYGVDLTTGDWENIRPIGRWPRSDVHVQRASSGHLNLRIDGRKPVQARVADLNATGGSLVELLGG